MRIEKLSCKFDVKNNYFFESLTVQLKEGRINFIQGDNGIGKSTLFTILRGNNLQTAELTGSIIFEGKTYKIENNRVPLKFCQKVHCVHQNYDSMIVSNLNVIDNLRLAQVSRFPGLRPLPQEKMGHIIDILGISRNIPVYLLSGGQRQLLAIAMALQKSTSVLLLDEPTATLDRKNARMVMDNLSLLVEALKITVLIICHDKEIIQEYAQENSFVMRRDYSDRIVIE